MSKTLQDIIDDYVKAKKELDQAAASTGRDMFVENIRPILHPNFQGLTWSQYTPYFNDGEPCVFGVYDPYIILPGDTRDNFLLAEERHHYFLRSRYASEGLKYSASNPLEQMMLKDPTVTDSLDKISDFFRSVPEDFFLIAFGDHQEITITHDDVTVEDVEHD